MIDVESIRTKIQDTLKERDQNLYAFSKEIGVSQPVLYRFLYRGATPTVATLNKILRGIDMLSHPGEK